METHIKHFVKGQVESTLFEFEIQTRVPVKSFLLLFKEDDGLRRLYFDEDVDLMRIFPFSSIEI